jgi:hypothetical protein
MRLSEKIGSIVDALFSIILLPLNVLGAIVSGVWLAILGEWAILLQGFLFMLFSGMLISFALIPSLLLGGPALIFLERGKRWIAMFFGSLSLIYVVALITIWCMWILDLFVGSVTTTTSIIPLLIWSYGVALGPWIWLAQKEQQQPGGNEYSLFTTFMAEISYLTAMIMFFLKINYQFIVVTFALIMLVGMSIQLVSAFPKVTKDTQV